MGLPQELGAVRIEFVRKLPDRAEDCDAKVEQLRRIFPVGMIFYRAGWRPFCNLHLRACRRALHTIDMPSARLLAISPQMPDASLSTAKANGIACVVAPEVRAAG